MLAIHKANQITLLVSRPPRFIILCGRAVIIHYTILWYFEGVASWNRPNGLQKRGVAGISRQ